MNNIKRERSPFSIRPLLQFRIRTLLLLTAILSVGLAWVAYERRQVQQRSEALQAMGGQFFRTGAPQQTWRQLLFGDDPFCDTIFWKSPIGEVTDADLAYIGSLTQLHFLHLQPLDRLSITDLGVAHLSGLTQLETLELAGTRITDAGLVHLRGLTQLKSLNLISANGVTGAGLAHLRGLTQLQTLLLDFTLVDDDSLIYLGGLTHLKKLGLDGTRVSDAGLIHLHDLTKLELLSLDYTSVSDVGVQELQKALPNVKIKIRSRDRSK